MLASLLLSLREGLEAALIVGIILGYLGQIGQPERRRTVWLAVGIASAGSLALALLLQAVGTSLEGQAEYIFEGLAMLLAVALLTWMIFWMRAQARTIKHDLEAEVRGALGGGRRWALFGVVFLAVFREGVELALFLTATGFVSDGASILLGGVFGLGIAILIGWAIYSGAMRLSLRAFFDVTTALLLVFAAGLFAHGIHELQEAGWIPVIIEHVWNLQPVLDDHGTVGALLRTLVGYNDNPSLIEALSYVGYWGVVSLALYRWSRRKSLPAQQAAT